MIDILTLAAKDLKLLLRDRSGFFFTFFWPIIMAMFFGSIFGGGSDGTNAIKLMVVDQDRSAVSALLLTSLEEAKELELISADLETANDSVRRGAVPAFLVIPEGFAEASANRFVSGAPWVELRTDPSKTPEAAMLEGFLQRSGASLLQAIFTDTAQIDAMVEQNLEQIDASANVEGLGQLRSFFVALQGLSDSGLSMGAVGGEDGSSVNSGMVPLEVKRADVEVNRKPRGPSNPYAVSFAQAMLWAVLGCCASFGISLAIERNQGTLIRLRMSPLRGPQILAGKGVACFATAFSMCLFLILLAVVVFGVRPLSWPLLMVAMTCVALCFVGVMMLLAVLGRTERSASGIGWAILLVMSMFGGGMVPLFVMPGWMKSVSDFSPVKWGIYAIEGAVWRGFSPAEMVLPCVILLAVGLVCFVVGARLFQWGELG